jgi:hypothetical protein
MAWSNWRTEDIGIKVSGAPAVSSWQEGRLDVFVRSLDNRLFHRVYENEAWQGTAWADLSDGHKIEVSPGAVSWGPNRIDLFAVWDKQTHHRAYQSGTWNPWTENLEGFTNDAPAAASWKFERVDVLVRTTDNDNSSARRLWESGKSWANGKSWKDWETVCGHAHLLMSAPAAVATGPNQIDCFGRGPEDHVIHAWYQEGLQGGIQGDWAQIDNLLIRDAPAAVSASTADRGRVDVFVRGADDLLKHRIYYVVLQAREPGGDTIYTAVQGDYLMSIARKYNMSLQALKDLNPQIKPPDYAVHPGDKIIVGYRDTIPAYGGWEPGRNWEDISPNKIASAPAAVGWWSANILKRIDCFAQDANNNLIHTWWK